MTRGRVHRHDADEEKPVNPEGSGSARIAVLAELHGLRGRMRDIQGSVVATTDGLVIAHDLGEAETFGVEPEGVAALSAVNLGLSQRIADTASHGDLRQTVIRGEFGQVITCAAGERALLTVLVRSADDIDGLHHHTRELAERLAAMLVNEW
jgi:predicted regulator of Ras-like GTPase activity (Roadblock/LC7/MglB family)